MCFVWLFFVLLSNCFIIALGNRSPREPQENPKRTTPSKGPQEDPKRTPRGPQKDPKRTPKGPAEDPERTPKGPRENPKRTPFGSPRTCAFGQSLHCAQSLLVCAKFARVRKVCAFAQSLRDCVKFARSRKVCAFHGACPGCCLIFKLQMLGLLIIPVPFWFNIWEAKPLIFIGFHGFSIRLY